MSKLQPSWRVILTVLGIDVPFVFVVLYCLSILVGLDLGVIVGPWLIVCLLRTIVVSAYFHRLLRPVDRWCRSTAPGERSLLQGANEALQRSPWRAAWFHGSAWGLGVVLTLACLWVGLPPAALGPSELGPGLLMAMTGLFGGAGLALPITDLLVERERAEVSRHLAIAGFEPSVERVLLSGRLFFALLSFVFMTASLILGPSSANHVEAERYEGITELGLELAREVELVEAGLEPEVAVIQAAAPPTAPLDFVHQRLPSLDALIAFDRRSETARLAHELPDGRWLVLEGDMSETDDDYRADLAVFMLVLLLWAPLAAALILRALVGPLRELDRFMRRLMDVGDVCSIEHLPVIQYDEIGALTQGFNEHIVELVELVEGAHAVAQGQLNVDINERGELGRAFLGMVEQLDVIVTQIRVTSLDVVTASAEIHANIQAQEHSSGQTREAVLAVTDTVATLAESATQIAESADDVLDNAERSSSTTDTVAARIDELVVLAGGISDLLEQIREIADRSDLLALNGSLEATRAGEAGRGFALVAAEMRRLAERVTATVSDVRGRITQIERSGVTTHAVMGPSRQLSNATADAARGITVLTRQQRAEAEVASSSIEAVADFVEAAAATSSQTRTASEGLRERIEELDRLVRQFETRSPADEDHE